MNAELEGIVIKKKISGYNALFKAKRKDNLQWICGYFSRLEDTYYIETVVSVLSDPEVGFYENKLQRHEVIPETIGQFTGACDKVGVKIFEHDIVFVPYNFIGKVTVKYLPQELKWNISDYDKTKFEVVGNKHDIEKR